MPLQPVKVRDLKLSLYKNEREYFQGVFFFTIPYLILNLNSIALLSLISDNQYPNGDMSDSDTV